ncbi:MAG: endonuclease domain-containing protein [Alphaproteobacteria bacterium]|nr:endonuclease domain-containing protein [Alphaproteobacteria bacterium]
MPRIAEGTKTRARDLRRKMTDAERALWKHLRAHRLEGWPFRRQHPIPPYVVDFASVEARLVIEVDGGRHAASQADAERDAFLSAQGWQVLRFWNNDVLANPDGVLTQLLETLAARKWPPP